MAYQVLDAFEGIVKLRLEWLSVPDEPLQEESVLEMEVVTTESFLAEGLGRGLEVRAEITVPVADIRDLAIRKS